MWFCDITQSVIKLKIAWCPNCDCAELPTLCTQQTFSIWGWSASGRLKSVVGYVTPPAISMISSANTLPVPLAAVFTVDNPATIPLLLFLKKSKHQSSNIIVLWLMVAWQVMLTPFAEFSLVLYPYASWHQSPEIPSKSSIVLAIILDLVSELFQLYI